MLPVMFATPPLTILPAVTLPVVDTALLETTLPVALTFAAVTVFAAMYMYELKSAIFYSF
jgi:hypothetical protein